MHVCILYFTLFHGAILLHLAGKQAWLYDMGVVADRRERGHFGWKVEGQW